MKGRKVRESESRKVTTGEGKEDAKNINNNDQKKEWKKKWMIEICINKEKKWKTEQNEKKKKEWKI